MKWSEYIEQKNGILNGTPIIKGTRLGVDLILEKMGSGDTIEELLLAYPHITKEAILACITFGESVIKIRKYN
jgi:uncharacterized protein (DUF433 family)